MYNNQSDRRHEGSLPYFLRSDFKIFGSEAQERGAFFFGPETLSLFERIFSKRSFYGKALPLLINCEWEKPGKSQKEDIHKG